MKKLNMRNIILTLSLIITTISYSQKIEINSNGLYINSNKISKQVDPSLIEDILGTPDRISLKFNTIWTYDKLGIRVYIEPNSGKVTSISLDFVKEDYDFSPKNPFSGEMKIYKYYISSMSPFVSVKQIPELRFESSPFPVYKASTKKLKLIFQYLESINRLEALGISFY